MSLGATLAGDTKLSGVFVCLYPGDVLEPHTAPPPFQFIYLLKV